MGKPCQVYLDEWKVENFAYVWDYNISQTQLGTTKKNHAGDDDGDKIIVICW